MNIKYFILIISVLISFSACNNVDSNKSKKSIMVTKLDSNIKSMMKEQPYKIIDQIKNSKALANQITLYNGNDEILAKNIQIKNNRLGDEKLKNYKAQANSILDGNLQINNAVNEQINVSNDTYNYNLTISTTNNSLEPMDNHITDSDALRENINPVLEHDYDNQEDSSKFTSINNSDTKNSSQIAVNDGSIDIPFAIIDNTIKEATQLQVLNNDIKIDSEDHNYLIISSVEINSADGTLSISEDLSSLYYIPNKDTSGIVSFNYTLKDNSGNESNVATVIILVNNVGSLTIAGGIMINDIQEALIKDKNGIPNTINYQWKRNGNDIENAILSTYILSSLDINQTITVVAEYDDNDGILERLTQSKLIATAQSTTVIDSLGDKLLYVWYDVIGPDNNFWMDRNVGASRVANSYNDGDNNHNNTKESYGGKFNFADAQDACPAGYRLPTRVELELLIESIDLNTNNNVDIIDKIFNTTLKLPFAGLEYKDESMNYNQDIDYDSLDEYLSDMYGNEGYYHSMDLNTALIISKTRLDIQDILPNELISVRCIKQLY